MYWFNASRIDVKMVVADINLFILRYFSLWTDLPLSERVQRKEGIGFYVAFNSLGHIATR